MGIRLFLLLIPWRGVCSAWNLVQDNTIWRIGNGDSIKFWKDCYIPNIGPLINVATGSVSVSELSSSIKDYVSDNNTWNVGKFTHLIPGAITNRINAMVPPNELNNEDCIARKQNNDGSFSVASASAAIHKYDTHPHKKLFVAIWQWKGPERIRIVFSGNWGMRPS